MTKQQARRYQHLSEALYSHGITSPELDTLLRCQRVLHTWAEHECNGTIQRDDKTGKPYWHFSDEQNFPRHRYRTPDREKGALRRVFLICAYHKLGYYHQGDPRGCCLYILRPGDVPTGSDPGSCYSNGIAMCID
jgi:hypothetical protein